MGKMMEVTIVETGKHFLKGVLVSEADVVTPSIAKPLELGQVSGLPQVMKTFNLRQSISSGFFIHSIVDTIGNYSKKKLA